MKYGAGLGIVALVCAACGAGSGSEQPAYPQQGYGYAYGAPPGYGSPPMYGYAPPPGYGQPPPPGYGQPPPPAYGAPGDPFAAARQRCVDETNAYRARVGAPPVVRRPDKEACSDADARGDASSGGVHGGAGGCGFGAQNECPGWPGPADRMLSGCLDSMFKEGPGEPYSEHGHYINMTNVEYRGVACGFYQRGDGSVWLIQNYFR